MRIDVKRSVVAILPIGTACLASATGKVTDVSMRDLAGVPAVHIGGTNLHQPTIQWIHGAMVLQFAASLSSNTRTLKPIYGWIGKVFIWRQGPVVDVAVWPLDSTKPLVARDANGWLVSRPGHRKEPAHASSAAQAIDASKTTPEPPDDALCSLQVTEMDPAQILQTLSTQTHANLGLLT